jgi:hypothetical protein
MLPSESATHFYNNSHEKEEGVEIDWCDICKKVTRHTVISGNNGLEDYDYYTCQVCGHKE